MYCRSNNLVKALIRPKTRSVVPKARPSINRQISSLTSRSSSLLPKPAASQLASPSLLSRSLSSPSSIPFKNAVVDGNYAAAYVAYGLSDLSFIYPITPSSPMGEWADQWSGQKIPNAFNQATKVTVMQSEAGAAGAVHGGLSAGGLVSTFTCSQGLLLMIPNMYKIAGEMMPCVFHVAARALAGQALSIFGDHNDVMSVRQTGFALLSSHNVQQAHDLALVSHIASMNSHIPFLHFFDGFRISHEMSNIKLMPYQDMAKLLPKDKLLEHRNTSLNPNRPHLRGSSQGPDLFMQYQEASNPAYAALPGVVRSAMQDVNRVLGTDYDLFKYCGHPEPDYVTIVMGSGGDIIEETIDRLMHHDPSKKYGVVRVHLFRPWSAEDFLNAIPKSAKVVCVMDRTKEKGAPGEPLYMDVSSTFKQHNDNRLVIGGRYGLGSKEFTPQMVQSVYENMSSSPPKHDFTVGIVDDVSHKSLPVLPNFDTVHEGTTQCQFWGLGSDGTVGANKNAIQIIGENTDMHVQGYFSLDAHKSGGLTVSHLRFGPHQIRSHYLITSADFVSVNNSTYVKEYNVLKDIKDGGTLVLNSHWSLDDMEHELPGALKREIAQKKLKFYNIDARHIADNAGLGKRINMVMQSAFFGVSGILPVDEALNLLKDSAAKSFAKKGAGIVNMNKDAIDHAMEGLHEVKYPEAWADAPDLPDEAPLYNEPEPAFVSQIMHPSAKQKGDTLPVSLMNPRGFQPLGTTKFEKRGISDQIPIWKPEKCTQCNICSFVCPHAAIRPFLITSEEEENSAPTDMETLRGEGEGRLPQYRYRIQVSPYDCTGCQVCVSSCEFDALEMDALETNAEIESDNWKFCYGLPQRGEVADKYSVAGSQFQQPLLEFSGACEGCGETPYVKLLTQLYGDRAIIANATGCSSIWGGTACTIPYTTTPEGKGPAWANSLFEDNAEYGLGMAQSTKQQRSKLAQIAQSVLDHEEGVKPSGPLQNLLRDWLTNFNDGTLSAEYAAGIHKLLEKEHSSHPLLGALWEGKDLFVKPSQWIIGGDGWAYDIGFGGLDHVLASGENVNILVLDTEVYSNTGGQMSKSTPAGAIVKFASGGKTTNKKDLAVSAIGYENVYVGHVSLQANYPHALKVFKEAESYPGVSLIIGYSPCIEHGYDLADSLEHARLAVDTAYWPLFRYDPRRASEGDNPFQLDSRSIKEDMAKMTTLENRFRSLKSAPEISKALHEQMADSKRSRHERFKHLHRGPQAVLDAASDDSTLVLYGSDTGNAAGLAQRLSKELVRRGIQARLMEADEYEGDLSEEKQILMCISTAGQGDFPANSKGFWKTISDPKLSSETLKNTKFAVFGLGDSRYYFFNKAAVDMDSRFEQLGGQRIMGRGVGDDRDDDKYETAWGDWEPDLYSELKAPAPAGDALAAPNYIVVESSASPPTDFRYRPSGTYMVPMVTNELMAKGRDTRNYEFDITGIDDMKYGLGDAMAIHPQNQPSRVSQFFSRNQMNSDQVVDFEPAPESALKDPYPSRMNLGQLFTHVLDIFGKPTRRFYDLLSNFASDPKEKDSLRLLASPEGKAGYSQFAEEMVDCADVFDRFPSARPPLDHLVDLVPSIKPRLYSIASSPRMHPDLIQLCIVAVDWPYGDTTRHGLCTSYLRDCEAGKHEVVSSVKPSGFKLPSKQSTPLVMVGAGTGVAPFRGFIQDRLYLQKKGQDVGPTSLFFGARFKDKEYLFGDEFEDWNKTGYLTNLNTAFSRDQDYKIYVQDRIKEQSELIYNRLVTEKGVFYLCGSSDRLPKDVRNAVKQAFISQGNMTEEAAENIIVDMQLTGRYNVEVW